MSLQGVADAVVSLPSLALDWQHKLLGLVEGHFSSLQLQSMLARARVLNLLNLVAFLAVACFAGRAKIEASLALLGPFPC